MGNDPRRERTARRITQATRLPVPTGHFQSPGEGLQDRRWSAGLCPGDFPRSPLFALRAAFLQRSSAALLGFPSLPGLLVFLRVLIMIILLM